MRTVKAKYVKVIEVKDPVSDGMFGVDSSYIEQVNHIVPSPFNDNIRLELNE